MVTNTYEANGHMSNKVTHVLVIVWLACAVNVVEAEKNADNAATFFQISVAEQIRQFRDRSLQDQYDLYIYGNQTVHPPATYLAAVFAERGPTIVPFLKRNL